MSLCADKRKYVRAPIQLKIKCVEFGNDVKGSTIHFSTTNVSAGGVFLETEKFFKPQTKLYIEIELPKLGTNINAVGTVMWAVNSSGESLNGMGISLDFDNLTDRKHLENFIINELAERL